MSLVISIAFDLNHKQSRKAKDSCGMLTFLHTCEATDRIRSFRILRITLRQAQGEWNYSSPMRKAAIILRQAQDERT